jgi:hypothetical protein
VYEICDNPRDFLDAGTPMHFLLRKLMGDGWTMGDPPKEHGLLTPKVIGQKLSLMQMRCYLQCLISLEALLGKGLLTLRSGESQGYYKALLSSSIPANVKHGRGAKYYKALLVGKPGVEVPDDSSEDEADLVQGQPLSESAISAPSPFARALQNAVPESSAALRPSTGRGKKNSRGDGEPQFEAMPIAGTLNVQQLNVEDSDSDNVQVGSSMPSQLAQKHKLRLDSGHYTKSGIAYRRWRIECPSACSSHWQAGKPCGKFRSLGGAQTTNHGAREPEAYLIAWAESAPRFKSKADHMKHDPSQADILAAFRNLDK